MECKLKKQEIVFDTAVFTYELLFENTDFTEYKKALESRKDTSMPIRAGIFFDMFPFCILYEVMLYYYLIYIQIYNLTAFRKTWL